MARWQLAVSHYLNVPGNEWEYIETQRGTGKQIRNRFPVPMLLDVLDPTCFTSQDEFGSGIVVVCHDGKGQPRDHIFIGDPTPDMIPLDDEAREISASFAEKWKHPIDSLPGTFSQSLIDDFTRQMSDVQTRNAAAASAPAQVEGMADLIKTMTGLMEQNAMLLAALAGKAVPQPEARR